MDQIDLRDLRVVDPAPVPREALEAVLAPFGSSRTLPGEAYTSRNVFEWERRWFLEHGWICVGRSGFRPSLVGPEELSLYRSITGIARRYLDRCG